MGITKRHHAMINDHRNTGIRAANIFMGLFHCIKNILRR